MLDPTTKPRCVALATCPEFPQLHTDDHALVAALAALGVAAEPMIWSDPAADWCRFDAVVLRSVWDYYTRAVEFRAWLDRLEAQRVPLYNPAPIVRRNLDKTYLRALAGRGLAVVPTAWITPADEPALDARLAELPWDEVVVKPAVSAGAFRTVRSTADALRRDPTPLRQVLQDATALVQPYLRGIERDGEWSFLFFGQTYSHAVVKRPKAGDFRVQWRHGGSHAGVEPTPQLRREAEALFAQLDEGALYTRIDGVIERGRFLLMEVELIEPYLFLGEAPGAAERFAAALLAKIAPAP
jgi:glutathione synthase/RimK-type ligase-like ATP-grasp enzyme